MPPPAGLEIMTEPNETKINRSTTIQVWLAAVIAIFVGGWVVKDQVWKTRVDFRLTNIEENLGDRWSRTQMTLWATEFKRLNPNLEIPSPFTVPRLFAESQ